jgi:putative ABC transport system substrate-binding protein
MNAMPALDPNPDMGRHRPSRRSIEMAGDPIKFGFVVSLNRPRSNLTGVSMLRTMLTTKQLEMLHETVPNASLIAFLVNPANPRADS